MAKYIDAEKIINYWKTCKDDFFIDFLTFVSAEEDVAPVIHAKWILNSFSGSGVYGCSNCRRLEYFSSRVAKDEYKYCPFCGAKMEKEEENGEVH